MEVTVKEFTGGVDASFRRGKRLDPFEEKVTLVNALYRILNEPGKTLTLLGGKTLANAVVQNGRLVIVKGFKAGGVVPARMPVESTPERVPKATLDAVKEFVSGEEAGLFYVVPVVAGAKPRPAGVEDLAKAVGRKVRVKRLTGTDFGALFEFEVSGVRFIGSVDKKGKDYTAKSIAKELTCEAVKELKKALKRSRYGRVYKALAGEPVSVKGPVEVRNIVQLARNFKCLGELKAVKKRLFSTRFPDGKVRLAVSRFIEEYEREEASDITDDSVVVKVAHKTGRLPEEDLKIVYAVLSKGKRTVFTGGVEVITEIDAHRGKLYIVEAGFGHVFKDTKVVGSMPLTFKEAEEVRESPEKYREFLEFVLSA